MDEAGRRTLTNTFQHKFVVVDDLSKDHEGQGLGMKINDLILNHSLYIDNRPLTAEVGEGLPSM